MERDGNGGEIDQIMLYECLNMSQCVPLLRIMHQFKKLINTWYKGAGGRMND